MLINGKEATYRMTPDNKILNVYKPGEEVEFREEDGKFHGGYVFLRKENEGDNTAFVFADPKGHEFTKMWWQILDMKNKSQFRLAWPDDAEEGVPPLWYERPVNS